MDNFLGGLWQLQAESCITCHDTWKFKYQFTLTFCKTAWYNTKVYEFSKCYIKSRKHIARNLSDNFYTKRIKIWIIDSLCKSPAACIKKVINKGLISFMLTACESRDTLYSASPHQPCTSLWQLMLADLINHSKKK